MTGTQAEGRTETETETERQKERDTHKKSEKKKKEIPRLPRIKTTEITCDTSGLPVDSMNPVEGEQAITRASPVQRQDGDADDC